MARSFAGIDEYGTLNEKSLADIVSDLKLYFRLFHGPEIGLAPGDPDLHLIQSVAPEVRTLWAGMKGAFLQAFISTAQGNSLEKACAVLRITRNLATKAVVEATFSRDTPAPSGGITIAAGTLVETDDGIQFSTDEDATIEEGDTVITVSATAVVAGADGNIGANTLINITSTLPGVDTVNNATPATNGSDIESDDSLRARALNSPAIRGKATPNAIRSQIRDGVDGVTACVVLVNNEDDCDASDTFINLTNTGTNSETISSGGNPRIAQKFTVPTGGKWIQDARAKLTNVSGATLRIYVAADNAGSPASTPAVTDLEKTGYLPTNNAENDIHFPTAGYLAAGSYWLVIETTAGSFKLDGSATGTADQVKYHNGTSWALSASIENGNVDIIAGLPPHSVQVYVQGGLDADIEEQLFDVVAAGIRTWGEVSGTVQDDSGNNQTVKFSRPTVVTVYVDVTVVTDDTFDATDGPNVIRDAIVRYIGGTDTTGTLYPGLSLGDDVIRAEIIAAIMGVTGVTNITTLKIDDDNPPVVTTGDLTIAQTGLARAETASGIDVTVT